MQLEYSEILPTPHLDGYEPKLIAELCTSQSKPRHPPPPHPHPGICGTLVGLYHYVGNSLSPQYVGDLPVFFAFVLRNVGH